MNFLAHCSLAHDAASIWSCSEEQRRGLLAGAVIGDFVKGTIPTQWPVALQAGARLHRKIDALSNVNLAIRTNCDRFPKNLRRLAPIFVDLLADHCLSLQWSSQYNVAIKAFSDECYEAIGEYELYMSPQARRFSDYMKDVDLLANYHEWRHIQRGLHSVLRRLRQEQLLEEVESISLTLLADTHDDFSNYYPELRGAWRNWNAFDAISAQQSS